MSKINEKMLEFLLLEGFRLRITKHTLLRYALVSMPMPTSEEMAFAIYRSLLNQPIPPDIQGKLDCSRPLEEVLNEFCEKRGLEWRRDYETGDYLFRIKQFAKAEVKDETKV